jgi:hypothetical protein
MFEGPNTVNGTLAGTQKDKTQTVASSRSTMGTELRSFDDLSKGQSQLEGDTYNAQIAQFAQMLGLVNAGPGQSEVSQNNQFQSSFAAQLQGLLSKVGNQSQADINNNYSRAQGIFAPEQTALNQQFDDQRVQSQRMSARLGRPGNDPILANKLAQEQTRQQTMLNSQIGSYGRQLPEMDANQIMNIGGQLSNLRQGLASQALQNRQTMLSMGNQLATSERNYRMGTATKIGTNESDTSVYSGGGAKGAAAGYSAGNAADTEQAGMAMKMGGSMMSMMSDERAKRGVTDVSYVTSFLETLRPVTYEYKNPHQAGAAEGRRYGILAQDLEKTDIGRSFVVDTPQGKMVDVAQGFGPVLAALAEINDRLKKLEGN